MEKRRYQFRPIIGSLWVSAPNDDELILNELKRMKLSKHLRKSKHDLTVLGDNSRLILRYLTGQAICIWNKKILLPRKFGIECSLFINNSQANSVELMQDAMKLARLCWIEYPLYISLNPNLYPENMEEVVKKCGWQPYGVNSKGFIIYSHKVAV